MEQTDEPRLIRKGESFTVSFEVTRAADPDDSFVPGEVREVSGATGYPRRDINWTTAKVVSVGPVLNPPHPSWSIQSVADVDEDDPEVDR